MKRIDLISMSKEDLNELQIPFTIKKDKNKLESWIIDREGRISELNGRIQKLKSTQDSLDIDSILDAVDELALEERRLSQGQELLKELF